MNVIKKNRGDTFSYGCTKIFGCNRIIADPYNWGPDNRVNNNNNILAKNNLVRARQM